MRRTTKQKPGPQLSDDRADKLWGALHHDTAERGRRVAFEGDRQAYAIAPFYWDAVEAWFKRLNDSQLESVDLIRDVWPQFADRRAAVLQHWTSDLPPAPKMPEGIAKIAASWGAFW